MKLKSLVAVAAVVCAPAVFATTNLGTLNSTAKSISTSNAFLASDYTFTIGSSSSSLSGTFGGSFFAYGGSASLYSGSGALLMSDSTPSTISFAGLSAGTYTLWLTGYNIFGSTITGSLSAASSMAAPVPEADSYAMLALGLSGVGLVGLRRRRS